MFLAYVPGMDVALIQWPSDEPLRLELAQQEHPRLLLVEPEADPPICVDVLEDWVRLPVSRPDRNARIKALEDRAGRRDEDVPVLSHDGTLDYGERTAHLSELQTRALAPLIDRFGAVVGREELTAHVWPEDEATANNLDVTIGRLRRQVEPLGLVIKTVRSRGYLLCGSDVAR